MWTAGSRRDGSWFALAKPRSTAKSACRRPARASYLGSRGILRGGRNGGRRGSLRGEPGGAHQIEIFARLGVRRGEQLLTVEDAVRAGVQAHELRLARELLTARAQSNARARHQEARGRDHAHELRRVDGRQSGEGSALHAHERVDRHTLRMRREARELEQHAAAIVDALAHTDDAARAHGDAGRRARCGGCGGDRRTGGSR